MFTVVPEIDGATLYRQKKNGDVVRLATVKNTADGYKLLLVYSSVLVFKNGGKRIDTGDGIAIIRGDIKVFKKLHGVSLHSEILRDTARRYSQGLAVATRRILKNNGMASIEYTPLDIEVLIDNTLECIATL